MTIIEVDNVKNFMKELFIGETFDSLLLKEGSITTFIRSDFDGALNKEFYSGDDEASEKYSAMEYCTWGMIKPYCYNLIKGKRIPTKMKFVFSLDLQSTQTFLDENYININKTDINALSINIRFENNKVNVITGTSLKLFSLDKDLENKWDSHVTKLIASINP